MARAESSSSIEESFVVLGQMRPNNRTTLINDDLVGTMHRIEDWALVDEAFR